MNNKIAGVYYILNTENDRIYIGQSDHVEQRFKSHLSALRSHRHHNTALQADWDHYGELAFTFDVLTTHTTFTNRVFIYAPRIEDVERIFIHAYQADNPLYGYNCNHSEKSIKNHTRARSLDTQANEAARKYRPKSLPIGVDNIT